MALLSSDSVFCTAIWGWMLLMRAEYNYGGGELTICNPKPWPMPPMI